MKRQKKRREHLRTINPHLLFWKLLTNIWPAEILHLTPPAWVWILAPLMALGKAENALDEDRHVLTQQLKTALSLPRTI